ncbi:MAG TPA: response regulator [Candidatus Acidoferrales bacterium]|nr:response regulator [Candidatus Acidoferrales bacterium]
MSEASIVSSERVPTVYFIDDSATMREVIKIAFRRESINVVTCHNAASALAQFAETSPDAVITDVIMPDKDGYEVCQFIKQNPEMRKIPVILMSGVVNRTVAEKAIAVQADELIRKPFQPQELIARVKNLLNPQKSVSAPPRQEPRDPEVVHSAAKPLSDIFAPPVPFPAAMSAPISIVAQNRITGKQSVATSPTTPRPNSNPSAAEVQRLRLELQRIEMLVKKLQSELEAERQYVASLESHLKTLQETD